MPKISLAGFKDPVRRPRYIIWTGVAVLVLAAVMIVALGVTSTRWFCAEGCHKVQDDSINAYNRSSHSEISCMACHMPVNASPIAFMLHKAEALGELYLTVTDNFELPLNKTSHYSLAMTAKQCTQCHNLDNRVVTTSAGIKMDHQVHAEVNAACPVCHNRVAHNESGDWEPALIDPASGEKSVKHADFMSMTACFRCHDLEADAAAPGACSACHPADFDLKPANHDAADFYPGGHAEMAMEAKAEVDAAAAGHGEEGEAAPEGEAPTGTEAPSEAPTGTEAPSEAPTGTQAPSEAPTGTQAPSDETSWLGPEKAYAAGGGSDKEPVAKEDVGKVIEAQREHGPDESVSIGAELPTVDSIFYCSTCHTQQFCVNCHGMEMPHPDAFKEPEDPKDADGHPAMSKNEVTAEKCVMCHGKNEETSFCDSCHHGTKVGWEFDKTSPWTNKQHPKAVAQSGVPACTTSCHTPNFCSDCHSGKNVYPDSHNASYWTKPKFPGALTVFGETPAAPSAGHALDAQKAIESCEVCHGSGGITAKFCTSCHKVDLPHSDEFKTNHVSSKKNSEPCVQCHPWKELCSNCHHVGSSLTKSWTAVHGPAVNKNGPASCIEKCHEKDDCVKCHTDRKVVPASHKPAKFTRDRSSKAAGHTELFEKDPAICTYCHAGEAAELPNSKFCKGCHKLEMPHKLDDTNTQKFPHKDEFAKKTYTKKQCANCHTTTFCDSCHHEGSVSDKPWVRFHPNVVKDTGAQPCFDCHEPTSCSNCHVNLAKRGLLD